MSIRIPENIVLCIDASRSMYRSDYTPSRLSCSIKAFKTLVEERLSEDPATTFAIVKYSDSYKKVLDFSSLKDELFDALDNLKYQGASPLGEALAYSIKLLIEELRKMAAKPPRIVLISDGNYTTSAADPVKMARLAKGLNIKIDTFRLGEVSHLNILKRLSDLSGGRYYYNNDLDSLIESAKNLAKDNLKPSGSSSKPPTENPAFLRKIAANLLRVQDLTKDQESRIKQIRGVADYKKCSICFSDQDPETKASFFLTGRFCPNCNSPFHVHCLAGWASSQDDPKLQRSGTVRCPHCFYLLKIPTEVTQVKRLKAYKGTQMNIEVDKTKSKTFFAQKLNTSYLGDEAFYNSCPVCNMIFEEDEDIIKCGNKDCGVLYHEECFKELDDSHCKNCGKKLKLE
ncbi:MAG: VWA domain-containing protein [Candidatus Lokiarchaeota archaeon]|nr:VWA domain-containing protein [Candidatus Lokiarchaeota archaeon]MBD3200728.1 VWA domain-containing protein [Candidatus Lokiarchaeota archaeon]